MHSIGEPDGRSVLQALWSPFQSASLRVENPLTTAIGMGDPHARLIRVQLDHLRGAVQHHPQNTSPESTSINLRTFRYFGGAREGCSLLPALFTKPLVESLAVCKRVRISPLRRKQA